LKAINVCKSNNNKWKGGGLWGMIYSQEPNLFGKLQIESEMGLKMTGLHMKLLKEQSF